MVGRQCTQSSIVVPSCKAACTVREHLIMMAKCPELSLLRAISAFQNDAYRPVVLGTYSTHLPKIVIKIWTKFPNLNDYSLLLQFSVPSQLKSSVKSRMKM